VGDGLAALIALIVFIASAALFARRDPRAQGNDEHGLPAELQGAQLAYAEKTFRSRRRKLVARLDRAYRVDGELRLLELKTREQDAVYMSDVIELSVQRIAVQDQTNERVSKGAWVVVQSVSSGMRRPHRVRLMSENEVVVMRERYQAVIGGTAADPRPARSLTQCAHCAHRNRCSAAFKDR
jgi:CRISPR-associated exonuclease Cas4